VADRAAAIVEFLVASGWGGATPVPLAGDASFRRYHRLNRAGRTALLMDAAPPQENVLPYLAVAKVLRDLGFSAPAILATDAEKGLLIIEDFGDETYTRMLAAGGDERALYALAVDVLVALHGRFTPQTAPELPPYDDARLLNEAALLVDWYLPAVTGRPTPADLRADYLDLWRTLFPVARAVPASLVLRDYHVDNLMRVTGRAATAACGLLDFQDAVLGPVSYDLVSLLEDARRDVAPALGEEMCARYLAAFPELDRGAFAASYAVLGAQRNCKIVGIFTRLDRRDRKRAYLAHIPRVWRLIEQDLRHPALAPMRRWFDRHIPPDRRIAPKPAS